MLNGVGQVNATQNRFEYQDKEKESTFGLNRINLGARTYNPTIGRFDRIDPLSDEQEAWTMYHYTYNNPVNYVDLFGLSPSSANDIAICPTCPKGSKYDEYRNSKSFYTYDKGTGIVLNGDGQGVTVYGKRTSYDYNGLIYGSGQTLNYLGDNSISTRGKLGGTTPGTSIASQYFRQTLGNRETPKLLFDILPKRIGLKNNVKRSMPIRSKNLGAVVGRTVPLLGRGLVGVSAGVSITM